MYVGCGDFLEDAKEAFNTAKDYADKGKQAYDKGKEAYDKGKAAYDKATGKQSEPSSQNTSNQTKASARGYFSQKKTSAAYDAKYSLKVFEAEKKRKEAIAAQEAAAKNAADQTSQLYADEESPESDATKAGIFGLPTYAVVGGVAVLGIAAFFVFSAKEKKG